MYQPREVSSVMVRTGASLKEVIDYDLFPKKRTVQKGSLTPYKNAIRVLRLRGFKIEVFRNMLTPRQGIDERIAIRHFAAVIRCFGCDTPKQTEVASRLLREWFILDISAMRQTKLPQITPLTW